MADDGFVLNIVSSTPTSGTKPKSRGGQAHKLQKKFQAKILKKPEKPRGPKPSEVAPPAARTTPGPPQAPPKKSGPTDVPPTLKKPQDSAGTPKVNEKGKKSVGVAVKRPAADPNDVSKAVLDSYMAEHFPELADKKRKADGTDDKAAKKMNVGRLSSLYSGIETIQVDKSKANRFVANVAASNSVSLDATFLDLGIKGLLAETLQKDLRIENPTNIQRKAIPVVLTGRDVLMRAQTGSGKTLAFLLPILQRICQVEPKITRTTGTLGLFIAPTRELALQIYGVMVKLVKRAPNIVPGYIIGGEKKKSEKARLRTGINLLVATPGRLKDHLTHTESFDISKVVFLVLDEADHLIELNFEREIMEILDILQVRGNIKAVSQLALRRQHILCSATISPGVKSLVTRFLDKPVFVESGGEVNPAHVNLQDSDDDDGDGEAQQDGGSDEFDASTLVARDKIQVDQQLSTPAQLKHKVVVTPTKHRLVTLVAFLRKMARSGKGKGLVFFSTCASVDFHYYVFTRSHTKEGVSMMKHLQDPENSEKDILGTLSQSAGPEEGGLVPGSPLYRLHGDIQQSLRKATFESFNKAERGILLTTDVAARGLDLPKVNWVVQFDPPHDLKDYVHRVGRTARIGADGEALLFLLQSETGFVENLKEHSVDPQPVSAEGLLEEFDVHGNHAFRAQELQNDIELFILQNKAAHKMSKLAFQAFIRSYITRAKQEKKVFAIKKVHLGHLAKSFGLREPPSQLTEKIFKTKGRSDRRPRPMAAASRGKPTFADRFRAPRAGETKRQSAAWVGSETVVLPRGMEHRKNSTPRSKPKERE